MSIREYLSFTRRERTGIVVLVIILVIVAILPALIPARPPARQNIPLIVQNDPESADSADKGADDGKERPGARYNRFWPRREGVQRLKYRTRFDGDSGRKWSRYRSDTYYGNNYGEGKSGVHGDERGIFRAYAGNYAARRARYAPKPVQINIADTSAFIALPGIGSKLAARIVSFREKLGGFYSVQQLRDVYGLRDSVFLMLLPYLKCDSGFSGGGSRPTALVSER